MDISRLSLNQLTVPKWNFEEAVERCARWDIQWIGVTRSTVHEIGLKKSVEILKRYDLKVSNLVRGALFPAGNKLEKIARYDYNRRAIDEAVKLGCSLLPIAAGPPMGSNLESSLAMIGRDIDKARACVEEGIAELIPYAKQAKVKLGLEPFHPLSAADRSVVVTMEQANNIIMKLNSKQVGIIIDVYHVWWDPNLYFEIKRATGKIFLFQVNDWVLPFGDLYSSRGIMGDGSIEIKRIRQAVEATGYDGPIEIEILNNKLWETQYDQLLSLLIDRFLKYV